MPTNDAVTLPASLAGRSCATQWFGPVAMHQPIFSMMWGLIQKMDIEAVAAGHATRRAQHGPGEARLAYTNAGGIAVLPVSGPVSKEESSMGDVFGGVSTTRLRSALQQALADPGIHSILLHIDSPGGTVAGVGDLADDIYAARKRKKVVTYYEDLGASAAVWIGSQANESYASRHAEVGSIGVYSGIYDMSKQAEMEGVKAILVSSGGVKGAGMPGTPVSEAAIAEMQKSVNHTNDVFLEAIRRGRGLSDEQAKKINTGQLWPAKDAKRLGLIDDVQPLSKVLAILQESAPRSRHAHVTGTIGTDGVAAMLSSTVSETTTRTLANLPSWSEDVLTHLEVAAMSAPEQDDDVDEDDEVDPQKELDEDLKDLSLNATPASNAAVDAPSKAPYNDAVLSIPEGSREPIVIDEAQNMEPQPNAGKPAPAASVADAASGKAAPEPSIPLSEVEALVAKAMAPLTKQIQALESEKTNAETKRIDDKRRRIALKHKVPESTLAAYNTEAQLEGIDSMLAARGSTHLDLNTLAPEDPVVKLYQAEEKQRKEWLAKVSQTGVIRRV